MVAALGQEVTVSMTVRPSLPTVPAGFAPMPQPLPGMNVGLPLGPQVPLRNRPENVPVPVEDDSDSELD